MCRDKNGYTALMTASQNGHSHIVKHLLTLEHINIREKLPSFGNALHRAASNGHLKVVELLLNHDKDLINTKTNFEETPLILATGFGRYI
jgi:ankyrin repeat protein